MSTTTFIVRVDNELGFDLRSSASALYTHAVVVGKIGDEGAASWHKSEAAAIKEAARWDKPARVVPVAEERKGAKATVLKQLQAEAASNDRVKAKAAPIKAKALTGKAKEEYDRRVAAQAETKPSKALPPVAAKKATEPKSPTAAKVQLITEHPGYVTSTKSRTTKTTVVLIDGRAGHKLALAEDKGRWQTICVDHSVVVGHPGQRPARNAVSHPELWCAKCKKATKA